MPISRLFHDQGNARAAEAELRQAGFARVGIHLFTREAGGGDAPAIVREGVPPSSAHRYAERVAAGEALLVVHAPMGFGSMVTEIMERPRPGETEPVRAIYETPDRDRSTPFSAMFNWPTLLRDPAPLSSWLKWPTLSKRQTPNVTLRSYDPAPLSRRVGWRVLSGDPAPLSKRFGWPLLSAFPAPLSKRLGWPLLSDKPAPFSKRLGWRQLSSDPAPFSAFFHWRTLSRDPAPLSHALGWRVLAETPPNPR